MALSGAFTGTTGNQYIFPTIKWSAVQSQDGNYSDVTATLYYSRSNSGYSTSGTWSGGITIDGQWTAGSRHIEVSYQSGTLAMSATVRVYHDADGSRSVTISAAGYIGGTTLSSTDISQTVTLDQIARASVPTTNKSSIAMGEEIIIYTNRKNTAFCHTARYTFAGQAATLRTLTRKRRGTGIRSCRRSRSPTGFRMLRAAYAQSTSRHGATGISHSRSERSRA